MNQNLSITPTAASNITYLNTVIGVEADFLGTTWASTVIAQLIEALMATVFFGVYTTMALAAAYLLLLKGKTTATLAVLLAVIIIAYLSTTAYWITILYELYKQISALLQDLMFILTTVIRIENMYGDVQPSLGVGIGSLIPNPNATQPNWNSWWPRPAQECAGTVSLTINVILGDAIVWWRAWVLWRYSKTIRVLCIAFITATGISGIVATTQGCRNAWQGSMDVDGSPLQATELTRSSGSLYTGDSWGVAASVISLVTNMIATSLIGYKAWLHRRLVASHLTSGSARTQAEKVLVLLIESGVIYCILWVFIALYEVFTITPVYELNSSIELYVLCLHYLVEGCLVALVGMYPTLIIILVAMNKTHCDRNFTYKTEPGDPRIVTTTPRRATYNDPVDMSNVGDSAEEA